jgi:type IV pilus assembly protein PilB
LIDRNIIKKHILLPVHDEIGILTVAMSDPKDFAVLDEIRIITKRAIRAVFADPDIIERIIARIFPKYDFEDLPKPVIPDMKIETQYMKMRLGRLLVSEGTLSEEQLNTCLAMQAIDGGIIGNILVEHNVIKIADVLRGLEKQSGIKYIDLKDFPVKKKFIKLLAEEDERKFVLVPIDKKSDVLVVAMTYPIDLYALDAISLKTGLYVKPLLSDENGIRNHIDICYGPSSKKQFNKHGNEQKKSKTSKVKEMKKDRKRIIEKVDVIDNMDEMRDLLSDDLQTQRSISSVNFSLQQAAVDMAENEREISYNHINEEDYPERVVEKVDIFDSNVKKQSSEVREVRKVDDAFETIVEISVKKMLEDKDDK